MDYASDVSSRSVERMLHILQTESKELARVLTDEEITPSGLIHSLITANVITTAHVPSILALDHTTQDKYTCLLKNVETVIATSISNGSSDDTAVLVKNFISTLLDNNLLRIAFRLHPELTDSINGSFAAAQSSPEANTAYFTASSSDSASPHMGQSKFYPTFGNGQFGGPCREAQMFGERECASDGNIPTAHAETGMNIVVEYNQTVFGPMDDETSDDETYRNSSKPRGLAFIANYPFFKNDFHAFREGSDVDVKNLRSLFEQMGYVVPTIRQDMTKGETLNALRKFRDDERHEAAHSCVVIIMSHGKDDNSFFTADGLYLSTVDVLELFSNIGCKALINKPKLFILQFCRGDRRAVGVPLNNVSMALREVMQTDSASQGHTRELISNKPTLTDMLLVYSTVEGYVSFRDPQHGSWLIEALCQIFMQHACKCNLDQLMKKVSKLVSDRESGDGKKQSCEMRSISVNKDFYFNPTATFDETSSMFPNLDALSSALSGYDGFLQLTPRGDHSSKTPSRWSLNSPYPSDLESQDAFYNSSGNSSSVENLSASGYRRTSLGNGNSSQHLRTHLGTGARPRVNSGGLRRISPTASPRPLSVGDPVQLHPRLLSGSEGKRNGHNIESAFNFFQPSMVESNGNGLEYSPHELSGSDCNTQLNVTLDSVDSRVGKQSFPVKKNRATPTGVAAEDIPENSVAETRDSSLEKGNFLPCEEKNSFNFGSNLPGEDVVSKKTPSASFRGWSREKSFERARRRLSSPATTQQTEQASSGLHPGASGSFSPVVPELSYQQFRRERSMELSSGSEFPEYSIKRQLSVESERDVIASIRKVKTYMQVNDAEHLIPQVDSLAEFVKRQKNANKKRKKEFYSQSQE